jgi:membrane protease YdiL (CAAX protease family)
VSSASKRPPWGFWHIVAILALSALGWAVGGVLLAVFWQHSHQRTLSLTTALALTALLYLVLYLGIVVVIHSAGGWNDLGYRFPGWKTLLGVVAFLPVWYAILAAVGLGSAFIINHGKPLPTNVNDLFGPAGIRGLGSGVILLAFVVAAVVAPIVEEALFRGVIYQWLRGRLGVLPAILLDGLLFASAHLISGVTGLWKLLPLLFVMGCLLATTFQRTRSLYATMLLHGANNALAIAALLVGLSR